jgi:uncharacterized GH25 family protein
MNEKWGASRDPVMSARDVAAAMLILLAVSVPAHAHEYWLAPSAYRAAAGDTVTIGAWVGTGFRGERKAYAPSRVRRFERYGPSRTNLADTTHQGDTVWARFVAGRGGTLVAYESNFAHLEMPAGDFDRYLEEEGLNGPRATRRADTLAAPVRERYARCPKTWIAGADTTAASVPRGLTLEIVPVADPLAAGPLEIRVLFQGAPLRGALVRAWNQPLARGVQPADAAVRDSVTYSHAVRTNAEGVARVPIDRPGEWLLSVVHMIPCTARAEADWESWWASFTFARGAAPR